MLLTPQLVIETLNMPAQQFWGGHKVRLWEKILAMSWGPTKN